MKQVLREGEIKIRETEANHYIEGKLMIGRLILTNSRIIFRTHLQNFRQYDLSIPLSSIANVGYKNNVWIFNHGIRIEETSGQQHNFSVWSRKKWKTVIDETLAKKHLSSHE